MNEHLQQPRTGGPQKIVWIVLVFIIAGLSACNNSGKKDIKSRISPSLPPVYVINGKVVTGDTVHNIIPRLKHKYVQSIHFISGDKAVYLYGKKAKGGAIKYSIPHLKKAFNDLLPGVSSDSSQKMPGKIYNFAEQQPVLIEGLKKLEQKVKYPKKCKQAGIKGRVLVRVVVNKQGVPVDPRVIKGLGHGCDKEAIRVAKSARFIPGKIDGEPVNVKYLIPVIFPPVSHKKE